MLGAMYARIRSDAAAWPTIAFGVSIIFTLKCISVGNHTMALENRL